MAMKTEGVHALVEDVLRSMPLPHTEDIIEDVFIRIENTSVWKTQYEDLLTEIGRDITNQGAARCRSDTGYQAETKQRGGASGRCAAAARARNTA